MTRATSHRTELAHQTAGRTDPANTGASALPIGQVESCPGSDRQKQLTPERKPGDDDVSIRWPIMPASGHSRRFGRTSAIFGLPPNS